MLQEAQEGMVQAIYGNPGPGNPSGPPGIDAIKSPNWGPYMRDLERRIKQNWNPPKGDASKRVVVMFKIGRDGRLLSIRIGKAQALFQMMMQQKRQLNLQHHSNRFRPNLREVVLT